MGAYRTRIVMKGVAARQVLLLRILEVIALYFVRVYKINQVVVKY